MRATTLHYFWCREFGKGKRQETLSRDITAQQRYTVLAGDFTVPSSLATLIKLAWCSALHLEPRQG
ncbi:hypothetical protein ACP0HM_26595 [Escherichia coli]